MSLQSVFQGVLEDILDPEWRLNDTVTFTDQQTGRLTSRQIGSHADRQISFELAEDPFQKLVIV